MKLSFMVHLDGVDPEWWAIVHGVPLGDVRNTVIDYVNQLVRQNMQDNGMLRDGNCDEFG